MSSVPRSLEESPLHGRIGTVGRAVRYGLRSAEAVTFWVAIALPFVYLPLLVGGFSGGEALLFAALLGLNGVALVAGHDHDPSA
ncbi:MAG: hypothetical protein ABEK02_03090 [Haloquadratum sp.]